MKLIEIIWILLLIIIIIVPIFKIIFYYSNKRNKIFRLGRLVLSKKMKFDFIAKFYSDLEFHQLAYIRNNFVIE
jgi:hypothetical protein